MHVLAGAVAAWALLVQVSDAVTASHRAQELVGTGKPAEAIGIYTELLRQSPDNPVLLLNLCIAEYTAKEYRHAIEHANAALRLDPALASASLFLGGSYLQLGEFEPAVETLKPVVAANPRERNARLMLGEALLAAERPEASCDSASGALLRSGNPG
jgi:tetratricopeptide (TPR) repeat protein